MLNFVQVQASGPWGLRPGGEGENFNHRNTSSILRIALKLHFVQNVEPDPREICSAFHGAGTEIGRKGAFCKDLIVRSLTNFIFISRFTFQGALGKVYLLATFTAHMCTVKLIRKDFFFFSTVWTFTAKGFKMLELSKAGTMLWSGHDILLSQRSLYNAW